MDESCKPREQRKEQLVETKQAVAEFLERYLGVRWLWPGELGEVIPKSKELTVRDLNVSGQEHFAELQMNARDRKELWASQAHCEAYAAARNKWLLRHRMNVRNSVTYTYGHYFHSNGKYTERFLKSRPDFFQLLPDGTRGYIPGMAAHKLSMCVSNPDLHKQIIEDWKGYRKKDDHPT